MHTKEEPVSPSFVFPWDFTHNSAVLVEQRLEVVSRCLIKDPASVVKMGNVGVMCLIVHICMAVFH